MPEKIVAYKEPTDYFSEEMMKAAQEWDREHQETGESSEDKTAKEKDLQRRKNN